MPPLGGNSSRSSPVLDMRQGIRSCREYTSMVVSQLPEIILRNTTGVTLKVHSGRRLARRLCIQLLEGTVFAVSS